MGGKKGIVVASLSEERSVKMQVGSKTTGRKALEALRKSGMPRAVGLRVAGTRREVDLEASLFAVVEDGDTLLVAEAAPAEATPDRAAVESEVVEVGEASALDPQMRELLRVAGPSTIAQRCTPWALARSAALEREDAEFAAVRRRLREKGFACNEELCEQRLSLLLPPDCRLLTIGAGFGATSMIAEELMDDPRRQVVVDPGSQFFPEYHLASKIGSFQTAQGFLGRSRQSTAMVLGDVVETYFDLDHLERVAGGPFDAVLADCEGAFLDIVDDFPELLERASWLCIEWDMPSKDDWVSKVRPRLLRAGFLPLDCGDRKCTCVNDLAKSYRQQGAPSFHEIFVKQPAIELVS